jgi:hypothetical protein
MENLMKMSKECDNESRKKTNRPRKQRLQQRTKLEKHSKPSLFSEREGAKGESRLPYPPTPSISQGFHIPLHKPLLV